MGLLDNFMAFAASDEGSGLAQGLLSANGSQGIAAGLAGMQRAKQMRQEMEMKRQFQAMQMQNYASEIEQRKAAIQKQAEIQKIMKGMFGGGQAPMSQGAFDTPAVDGVGPTIPQAMQRQAQNPGLAGQSIDHIAMLHAAGGPNLMDAYKWVKEPQKLEGGSTYENRATGAREMIPKMPDGMVFNNGAASLVPGYAGALGQVTAATEGSKANFDVIPVDQSDGTKLQMPRSQAVQRLSGLKPLTQGEAGMRTAVSGGMGADPKAIDREIDQMTADLQRLPDQKSRDLFTAQIADLQRQRANIQQSAPILGQSQSPADAALQEANRVKLVEQAKADVQPTDKRQSAIASTNYLKTVINKALEHPGRETATGLSGTIDPRNYLPGTDAKDFKSVLDQIKGSAFMQAFESLKGGGQITEVEGDKATAAIARLSTAQSDKAFKEALNELNGYVNNALLRAKSSAARAGATGSFDGDNTDIPAAPRTIVQAATRTPMKGQVMDGYRFKGGDPANPNSWERK